MSIFSVISALKFAFYSGRAGRSQLCCVALAVAAKRRTDKDSNDTDSDSDCDDVTVSLRMLSSSVVSFVTTAETSTRRVHALYKRLVPLDITRKSIS